MSENNATACDRAVAVTVKVCRNARVARHHISDLCSLRSLLRGASGRSLALIGRRRLEIRGVRLDRRLPRQLRRLLLLVVGVLAAHNLAAALQREDDLTRGPRTHTHTRARAPGKP